MKNMIKVIKMIKRIGWVGWYAVGWSGGQGAHTVLGGEDGGWEGRGRNWNGEVGWGESGGVVGEEGWVERGGGMVERVGVGEGERVAMSEGGERVR